MILPPNWDEMSTEEKGQWLKEHDDGKRLNLDINLSTKEFTELAQENSDLKGKLRLASEFLLKIKKEKVGCSDPEVDTPSKLKQWIEEHENDSKNYYEPPIGRGSSGSLKLKDATGQSSEGFDSEEQMIDYLVNTKNSLESTPEQREQASKILGELYRKTFEGLKKGTGRQGEIFVDPLKDGKSVIKRALDRQNEAIRREMIEDRKRKKGE